jgi:rubrerythrin
MWAIDMGEEELKTASGRRLRFEQPVFDDTGEKLGVIRGFDESGFYVRTPAQIELREGYRNDRSGEFDLLWRCWNCGELGTIGNLPETCPSCGAPKEDLYYWTED